MRRVVAVVDSDPHRLQAAAAAAAAAALPELAAGLEWRCVRPDDPAAPDAVRDADIALAAPPAVRPLLPHMQALRWMQSSYAGVDALFRADSGAPWPADARLTRTAGCFGPLIAQYVLGVLFSLERKLPRAAALQRERRWAPEELAYRPLSQVTVGLLGLGDIGGHVKGVLEGLGVRVVGLRRRGEGASLAEVLAQSDYVVNTLPSTAETVGLLDGDALAACRGAVLVNVGRGDVVAEEALVRALDEGWLQRAVLDVFAVEPLPEDSALWAHPRVDVTPHVAAVSFHEDVAEVFAENLGRFLSGAPAPGGMKYEVDCSVGY